MIQLRKLHSKNLWEILALEVADSQKSFVATNTQLYHSFGFTENGEMDADEIVAVVKL